MTDSQDIALFSVTENRNYRDTLKLALSWMEERTNDYVIKSFSARGLDDANIPRTVRGKNVKVMRKDDTESRAAIFLFIDHQLAFSASEDQPTALVVPSIEGFHELIYAKNPELFAMDKELPGIGEPPADPSPQALGILEAIGAEYHSYGRSLHGSSLATKHIKNHLRELKRLPGSQAPTKKEITYWLWTQNWEGNGVRDLLDYWEKAKR